MSQRFETSGNDGSVSPINVAKDVKDVYHELSKQIHYPEISDTGLICAGSLPLRAAVGLAFLQLQRLSDEKKLFRIKYADQNYIVQKVLISGSIHSLGEASCPVT
jgi:hypothetical protein